MLIPHILRRAAALWPDSEAVVDGETRLTYAELARRVGQLSVALAEERDESPQVVAIVAPNVLEHLETYFAAAAAGAVLCPLSHRLAPAELAEILDRSGGTTLVAHTDFAETVVEAAGAADAARRVVWVGGGAPAVPGADVATYDDFLRGARAAPPPEPSADPSALAHLYFTSGTTGRPKGVMLTHRNVTTHALAAIAELALTDADRWLHAAPLFHLADAWATFAVTWVGGRHVCLPRFDPVEALALIEREGVTLTNLVPTMLNVMVKSPEAKRFDLSSLRVVLSGGASIAPEIVRRVVSTFGCDYVQTYGMTETSPYLTLSILKEHQRKLPPEEQLRIKSRTGRPFLGVELRVVREDGANVEADDAEVGEIIVRGPTVTPGYYEDPEATREAFSDGWLRTGDLAVVDAEGSVNIVDRKKDVVITGGENVHSTEVENALYEHPAVLECAVFGVPDETWGEAVKAAVVLNPEVAAASEADLIAHVRLRLASYKAPRSIDLVPELPKTGSGKISKAALREPYWRGRSRRIG